MRKGRGREGEKDSRRGTLPRPRGGSQGREGGGRPPTPRRVLAAEPAHSKGAGLHLFTNSKNLADVANTYNNIGIVYRNKGDLENALLQHQRALEIRTRVYGQEHLDVAASYNNIVEVYRQQGRYEEALDYYHRSLDIKVRVLGPEHRTWPTHT